jgi:glycosyltransferase involved in cell wall biosynthesis
MKKFKSQSAQEEKYMKLSIVMMIKNESKYLERCLLSIKPIQAAIEAEIIIVDTGSVDNSVEIAKKHTDKVYYHPWNNDFAAMRNITISYATGEWIFILDGDEIIDGTEDFINFFRTSKCNKYNTGIIRIKNYSQENEARNSLSLIPRLFKKAKGFKYTGAIHEQPEIKEPIYYFKEDILHYGYITTDPELMERKYLRNTQILKSELEQDSKNIYLWFQLAQSYAMHGDREEALEADLKAYELAKTRESLSNRMYIYNHLAMVYDSCKKYDELEKLCLEALAFKDGYIDLYYLLAKAQLKLLKNMEAINNYHIYLDMVGHYEDFVGSKDISVTTATLDASEHVYTDLCILYHKEKQYEKVLEHMQKIHAPNLLQIALPSIINTYIKLSRYTELKEFYDIKILAEYEKLTNDFTNILETEMLNLNKQERNVLNDIFSHGESAYSLLNCIRTENKLKGISPNSIFIERIEQQNFSKLPLFYGEMIHYLLRYRHLSKSVILNLRDTVLEQYFGYIITQYKRECVESILAYTKEEISDDTIDNIRIRKVLGKLLLLSGMFCGEEYEQIFRQYVEDGIKYIYLVYNNNIILDERINDVKSEEDAMFIYMDRAEEIKSKDRVEYIRYLKKALNIYPNMAKGMEVLKQKLEDELNTYKEDTKQKIRTLIESGNLLRAHKLVHDYERMIKNDIQIYSMKAIIAIMEDRLGDAEIILTEGLEINNNDLDLLHNLQYVYEQQGNKGKSDSIHKKI